MIIEKRARFGCTIWGAAALSVAACGCSSLTLVQAGGAYAPGDARQSAGTLEGTAGAGASYDHGGVGPAIGARLKAGPHVAEVAFDASIFFLAGPRWIHPHTFRGQVIEQGTPPPPVFVFGTASVTMLDVGSVLGRPALGAGGPSGRLGLFVRLPNEKEWGLAISAGASYERRTGDVPDTGYLQLSIGLGKAVYGRQGVVIGAD